MDYRQMPTELQEYLFKRWLKQAKKEAVEFRMHGEQSFTTEIHSRLRKARASEYEGRSHVSLQFENGQVVDVPANGYWPRHYDGCNLECKCPRLVLYSYQIEGSPEWHDYEDWLAQFGLDFHADDEELSEWTSMMMSRELSEAAKVTV